MAAVLFHAAPVNERTSLFGDISCGQNVKIQEDKISQPADALDICILCYS